MGVIIGMDPHKRSATIEVIGDRGEVLATGRYGTGKAGYAQMLTAGRRFGGRVWAIEGCNGAGRHIAHRLVAGSETVVDVRAKLSAQVRVFATGNGRKTDPAGAHSVALAALRSPNLVKAGVHPDLVALGLLADRRDELGRARTQTINRIHRLLLELRDKPGDTAAIENRHADTTQADRGVRVPLNVTRPNFAAGLSSAFPGVMRVGQPLGSPHWPGPRLVGRPAANAQTRLPDSDAAGPKAS